MYNREWLLVSLVIMGALLALVLNLTGCMTDPSQWRPESHERMARSCRVACHPGRMLSYDSMDGSCTCTKK